MHWRLEACSLHVCSDASCCCCGFALVQEQRIRPGATELPQLRGSLDEAALPVHATRAESVVVAAVDASASRSSPVLLRRPWLHNLLLHPHRCHEPGSSSTSHSVERASP